MLSISKNKRLTLFLAAAIALLCIPAIAMNFTSEVSWGILDFIVAGSLLIGTVIIVEVLIRKVKNTNHLILFVLTLLLLLLFVWIELAVGIFS